MRALSSPSEPAVGRRDLLKKLAVGGAAAWASPVIASAPAAAQQGSTPTWVTWECMPGGVTARATPPLRYVNAGYFYGVAIWGELADWDSCASGLMTEIDAPRRTFGFSGFGAVGTIVISVHAGDCDPIESATITFDCRTAVGPAPDPRRRPGTTITRSPSGEVTVTSR